MAYELVSLGAGAWSIEEGGVRSFLFAGSEKALLVDTGFGTGDLKSVVDGLTALPVMLVNTHADPDHIGCNHQFEAAYMHPAEFETYAGSANAEKNAPPSPLWEGDVIDIGGRAFEVIHLPGHTNGSIALLDVSNRMLVSGDSVTAGPVFMFGQTRSLRAHIASMEKLLARGSEFDVIYPSHGTSPVSADSAEKLRISGLKLLRGELEGAEPPFEMPAKMYLCDGHGYFY